MSSAEFRRLRGFPAHLNDSSEALTEEWNAVHWQCTIHIDLKTIHTFLKESLIAADSSSEKANSWLAYNIVGNCLKALAYGARPASADSTLQWSI